MQKEPLQVSYLAVLLSVALLASAGARGTEVVEPDRTPELELRVRQVLMNTDYVGSDYPRAVTAAGGEIKDPVEYEEMLAFTEDLADHVAALRLSEPVGGEVIAAVVSLRQAVESQAPPSEVADLSRAVRAALIRTGWVQDAPREHPSEDLARRVFYRACASCHGEEGRGDGPGAGILVPRPADLREVGRNASQSPARVFNTLTTGISGMPSFAHLSEQERWSLACYVFTLGATESSGEELEPAMRAQIQQAWTVRQLMNWDQSEVVTAAQRLGIAENQLAAALRYARGPAVFGTAKEALLPLDQPTQERAPAELLRQAARHLELTGEALGRGAAGDARRTLMASYLEFFEPYEKSAVAAPPGKIGAIEQEFLRLRQQLREGRPAATEGLEQNFSDLAEQLYRLAEVEADAASALDGGPLRWESVAAAWVVVLREGFEAFLIVTALLAMVGREPELRPRRRLTRAVHLGWVSALLAGGATFWILQHVVMVSGLATETFEGVCTLVAAALLFYTGFWLLSGSRTQMWQGQIRAVATIALVSRKIRLLAAMAFVAVYRESVETILFLQGLLSTGSVLSVGVGSILGACSLAALCWGIRFVQVSVPMGLFFRLTSVLMIVLSFVMVGHGVMEFIEADLVSATLVPALPRLGFIGVFPYVETLVAQLALGAVAIAVAVRERRRHQARAER